MLKKERVNSFLGYSLFYDVPYILLRAKNRGTTMVNILEDHSGRYISTHSILLVKEYLSMIEETEERDWCLQEFVRVLKERGWCIEDIDLT